MDQSTNWLTLPFLWLTKNLWSFKALELMNFNVPVGKNNRFFGTNKSTLRSTLTKYKETRQIPTVSTQQLRKSRIFSTNRKASILKRKLSSVKSKVKISIFFTGTDEIGLKNMSNNSSFCHLWNWGQFSWYVKNALCTITVIMLMKTLVVQSATITRMFKVENNSFGDDQQGKYLCKCTCYRQNVNNEKT